MISPGAIAAMQQFQLGELWLYGSYTSSQALSSQRVVWNAEAIDTLNAFSPTSSIVTVPAGVGSARVWARVRHDGQGGSAAGTVFARIQRSTNGGSTWDTIAEGTASHPGGTPDQTIDVPEANIAVSPGHQFRVLCGPSGTFGLVSYGNDPSRTFLRFEWGA
ncbi:hypothetical protein [Roseomonas sp. AR75]|uniref:hypothetical protein n=1 Tax=Roseomonas sp. AR75 TaxID=2562311 RepID=UPI0010C0D14F|nr:hypothetical protein [Roseomonas sp. AR75]